MARETAEAPQAVARFLDLEAGNMAALGRRIAALNPPLIATCARGSSDHAAGFLKYALEIATGLPVASIGPSIASIYDAPLKLGGAALVTISQSGKSPDLVALQAAAKRSGALTVAFGNVDASPIAEAADVFIPLHAGPELSVAATKSFVASIAAVTALVANISGDGRLQAAISRLPDHLAQALNCDWSAATETFSTASSIYTVGRGPTFSIAQEAALKCKETAALHVEAFSMAEIMHGPLRLVENGFPVLAFAPDDRAAGANRDGIARLARTDANVFSVSPLPMAGTPLPAIATGHGVTDAITMILSFYRFAEILSRARGFDPDRPANLAKVTETL
jgi:glucosamine--fructose-6-phosphate aminotransferase (isomerizing)